MPGRVASSEAEHKKLLSNFQNINTAYLPFVGKYAVSFQYTPIHTL